MCNSAQPTSVVATMLHGCCTCSVVAHRRTAATCCTDVARREKHDVLDSLGLLGRVLVVLRRLGELAGFLVVAPHRGPVDADGGANFLGRHTFRGHGRDLRATFLLVLVRALTVRFITNDGTSTPFTHGES